MDKLVEVKAIRQSIQNLFGRLQSIVPQGSYEEYSKEELIMIATGLDEVMPLIEEIENKVALLNTKMSDIENNLTEVENNLTEQLSGKAETSHTHTRSQITDFPAIPSVGNGSVTIKQNGVSKGVITMNQSADAVIELTDNDTTYTAASAAPKAPGTAAVGTSANYAREDHVHPAQTSVSGNAGTATKLATARKIGNASFDGSTDIMLEEIGAAYKNHTNFINSKHFFVGSGNIEARGSLSFTIFEIFKIGWLNVWVGSKITSIVKMPSDVHHMLPLFDIKELDNDINSMTSRIRSEYGTIDVVIQRDPSDAYDISIYGAPEYDGVPIGVFVSAFIIDTAASSGSQILL